MGAAKTEVERLAGRRRADGPAAVAFAVGPQAWATLAITTAIYTFNVADRFLFSTLLQPIKAEFGFSDAAVASLNLALGLVLMGFGIPAGVLADRLSRRVLLAASTTTFSLMTALGGLAPTLPLLVATRLGVGLGEAGCTPPSLSLIADRFPPARRGMAMTIFTLGICAGSFLGATLAGRLNDSYGWHSTVVVFGVLGLPLGALALLFVREPVRGGADAQAAAPSLAGDSVGAALAHIWREKTLLFVMLGGAAICTWGWGLLWWTPAFLIRTYGLTAGASGAVLGKVHLLGGATATLLVALGMHWLSRRAPRVQIWSIASIIALAAVASIFAYTVKTLSVTVLCIWMFVPVLYMYTGPTFSLINNFSPPQIRAKVVSVFLFATSFGNLILAPVFIGLCSDLFTRSGMDAGSSLRHAMEIFAPLGLAAAAGYATAGFCSGSQETARSHVRTEAMLSTAGQP